MIEPEAVWRDARRPRPPLAAVRRDVDDLAWRIARLERSPLQRQLDRDVATLLRAHG